MDEYKNTNADPGGSTQPIKPGGTSLRTIVDQGTNAVQFLVDSQPFKISNMFGVKEGAAADIVRASSPQTNRSGHTQQQPTAREMFARGDIAFDEDRRRKVTILKTNIDQTRKGRPIHQVVDNRTGDKWRQRESRLRHL